MSDEFDSLIDDVPRDEIGLPFCGVIWPCKECGGKRTVYDEQRGFIILCPKCVGPEDGAS